MSNQRSLYQQRAPSGLDGSYLSLTRPQILYKNNGMACRSPSPMCLAQPCRNSCLHEARNGSLLENGLHGKCNNVVSPARQKLPPHAERTPDVGRRKSTCPLQTCSFHKKLSGSDHNSFQDGTHIPKRYSGPHCESFANHSFPPHPLGLNGSPSSRSKETDHGKKLSEERRRQLVLQKLELEIEKERLQNLLAKQEAKLLLQQQQLHQSRLDYNRFKGHTPHSEELLVDEALMRAGGLAPLMNGTCGRLSSPRLNCEGCYSKTPASGRVSKAPGSSGGNSSGKKSVGFGVQAEAEALWEHTKKETVRPRRELSSGFQKDAATSPGLTGGRKELASAATSPIHRDTSRYEASLLDLVDAMSPGLPYSESHSHSKGFVPESRARRRPGWNRSPSSAKHRTAELEESRILEEIFFI